MPPVNKRRKKPAEATPKAEGEIVQLEQRIKDVRKPAHREAIATTPP
jgi:hypothetical protein